MGAATSYHQPTTVNLNQLSQWLGSNPIDNARSFKMKKSGKLATLNPVVPETGLIPQTGVQGVDKFVKKGNALIDLGGSTITEVPKALIKGGLFGSIGGALAGVLLGISTRAKTLGFVGAILGLGVFGGIFGALINTSREVFTKVRRLTKIVTN